MNAEVFVDTNVVSRAMIEAHVSLPRSAFSPRETARAGDVWRLFQDVAVAGSIGAGWPPERYGDESVSFIVRSMVVLHHAETTYGERLVGTTWPSRFRRGLFFRRECRVRAERGPIASATQEWVHVATRGGGVELAKASDALTEAFPVETHDASVTMLAFEPIEAARTHRLELEPVRLATSDHSDAMPCSGLGEGFREALPRPDGKSRS